MPRKLKSLLRALYFISYRNRLISIVRAALTGFEDQYRRKSEATAKNMISLLSPDLRILSGPFRGLHYPFYESAGSAFTPKIIGTYEKELHPYIEGIIENRYSDVFDVGSAEGYYAVGFALRIPQSKITAFDISSRARNLLQRMAQGNGVLDRVTIRESCDSRTLEGFHNVTKGLIFSDCEGYELELFKRPTIEVLKHFDFLIETHDRSNLNITKALTREFNGSHNVHLIKGRKRTVNDFPVNGSFTSREKLMAMDEGRYRFSKWLFCRSIYAKRHNGHG